jgi:hypothetical protein
MDGPIRYTPLTLKRQEHLINEDKITELKESILGKVLDICPDT